MCAGLVGMRSWLARQQMPRCWLPWYISAAAPHMKGHAWLLAVPTLQAPGLRCSLTQRAAMQTFLAMLQTSGRRCVLCCRSRHAEQRHAQLTRVHALNRLCSAMPALTWLRHC